MEVNIIVDMSHEESAVFLKAIEEYKEQNNNIDRNYDEQFDDVIYAENENGYDVFNK